MLLKKKNSSNPKGGCRVQFPTWINQILKSGQITISTNDTKNLELRIQNKKIDLNIIDKKILKIALQDLQGGSTRGSLLDLIRTLKGAAEQLKDQGYTFTVSYYGKTALIIGEEASPMLSKLVTRTNAVEIKNLGKLLQMAL
jgi:hypothetical protein